MILRTKEMEMKTEHAHTNCVHGMSTLQCVTVYGVCKVNTPKWLQSQIYSVRFHSKKCSAEGGSGWKLRRLYVLSIWLKYWIYTHNMDLKINHFIFFCAVVRRKKANIFRRTAPRARSSLDAIELMDNGDGSVLCPLTIRTKFNTFKDQKTKKIYCIVDRVFFQSITHAFHMVFFGSKSCQNHLKIHMRMMVFYKDKKSKRTDYFNFA